jgi:hypothetical protein
MDSERSCRTTGKFLSLYPQPVFTCFLWISEQTAIISLYSINWLGFVTETECVYCAVRTERLTVVHITVHLEMVRPWLRRLIAGLLPRRPGFDHRSIHVRCVMDKVALERGFLGVFLFSLSVSFHECLYMCCSYQNERAKFGNVSSKIREHYTEMHYDVFVPSDVRKFKNEYLAVNTLPLRQMFLPRVPAILQAPRYGERDQW